MGTSGFRIWRHKNRFLMQYFYRDAYPDGLGMVVWNEIPRESDEFEQWLLRQREWVEDQLAELEAGELDRHYWRTGKRPDNYHDTEWLYELDLDSCVLHIDNFPVFNLRRMPPTADALHALAEDTTAYVFSTIPSEHRWDSDAELFVTPVESKALKAYNKLAAEIVTHIVPPPPGTDTTKVRRRFAETFVAMLYASEPFARATFEAYTIGHDTEISHMVCDMFCFLNYATLRSPTVATTDYAWDHYATPLKRIWNGMRRSAAPHGLRHERISWVRANVCVHFHPHLTDEPNLRMGVVNVVNAVRSTVASAAYLSHSPVSGNVVYGVLNSLTHCALVYYDTKTRFVRHTAAMPLLPPWKWGASTATTAGITALTSLCQHLDSTSDGLPGLYARNTAHGGRLPFDVLVCIAFHIDDSETLFRFAAASRVCKQAAKPRLMLPKLNGALVTACYGNAASPLRVRCADGMSAFLSNMWLSKGKRKRRVKFGEVLDLFTSGWHDSYHRF